MHKAVVSLSVVEASGTSYEILYVIQHDIPPSLSMIKTHASTDILLVILNGFGY